MKKFVYLMLCGISLTVACKKQNESLPENKSDEHESAFEAKENVPSDVLKYLAARGFDTSNTVRRGQDYVVEGDISFPVSVITAALKNDTARSGERHSYHTIIGPEYAANINLVVGGALRNDPEWVTAIRIACKKWNEITNCRINLIFDPTRVPLGVWEHITVLDAELGPGTFGRGDWPVSTVTPGPLVRVDLSNTAGWVFQRKVFLIMHELGHNIGFRHADLLGTNNQIPGTPDFDANSVMNSGGINMELDVFSNFDVIAAQYMYPKTSGSFLTTWVYGNFTLPFGAAAYEHFSAASYECANYTWELLDESEQVIHTFNEEGQNCYHLIWEGGHLPRGQYYLRNTVTGHDISGVAHVTGLTIQ